MSQDPIRDLQDVAQFVRERRPLLERPTPDVIVGRTYEQARGEMERRRFNPRTTILVSTSAANSTRHLQGLDIYPDDIYWVGDWWDGDRADEVEAEITVITSRRVGN